MAIADLLADYGNAIRAASNGSPGKMPYACYSVLKARFFYNVGPRYHSLYDLSCTPERCWSEYLIDVELKRQLRRINPPGYRKLVDDKLSFFEHSRRHALSTVPVLAAVGEGVSESPLCGNDPSKWIELLADAPARIFIKLVDGSGGVDAFIAEREREGIWKFEKQQGSIIDLHDLCIAQLSGRAGWIVQPFVMNTPDLQALTFPGALATVRAVTVLDAAGPDLLFAVLRLPVAPNQVDNFAHGCSGNLVAPIDLETGILGPGRCSASRSWPVMREVAIHPDSRESISGFPLPLWPELKRLVLGAQATLPELPSLGWDIAITSNGPIIIEANAQYDIDLVQVAHGRGLRSELLNARLARQPELSKTA